MSSASTPSGLIEQKLTSANNNTANSNGNSVNSFNSSNPSASNPLAPNPSTDRYAALSDLFNQEALYESSDNRNNVLSKSMSSSILSPPQLTSLPRPPSKRNQTSPQLSHQSSSSISRCESVSSLSSDFRMTPISVGSSRGPSPLTLGISDVIPIAVAVQESVSACFKGSDETKCQVHLVGSIKIAFPAGIVQVSVHYTSIYLITCILNYIFIYLFTGACK